MVTELPSCDVKVITASSLPGGRYPTARHPSPPLRASLNFLLQYSTDLEDWGTGLLPLPPEPSVEVMRALVPVESQRRGWFRLRAEWIP